MALLAIADLHLALGVPEKSMEAFRGRWIGYEEKLKENWNRAVSSEDTVVISGDISWGISLDEAKKDLEFINSLPGEKLLLEGNHDFWWNSLSKMESFCRSNGFDTIRFLRNNAYEAGGYAICGTRGWYTDDRTIPETTADSRVIVPREKGRLRASLEASSAFRGEKIVFMHFPPVYQGYICDEFVDVMEEYGVKRCYFGHIHGRYENFGTLYRGIEFRLISADSLDFTPQRI